MEVVQRVRGDGGSDARFIPAKGVSREVVVGVARTNGRGNLGTLRVVIPGDELNPVRSTVDGGFHLRLKRLAVVSLPVVLLVGTEALRRDGKHVLLSLIQVVNVLRMRCQATRGGSKRGAPIREAEAHGVKLTHGRVVVVGNVQSQRYKSDADAPRGEHRKLKTPPSGDVVVRFERSNDNGIILVSVNGGVVIKHFNGTHKSAGIHLSPPGIHVRHEDNLEAGIDIVCGG